jgi:hypothetical protein
LLALQDPGLGQHFEVMAHCRLRQADRCGEVARADFAVEVDAMIDTMEKLRQAP